MQVVEPHHIAKYSQCPKRALLSWNLSRPSNLDFEGIVLQHVIQAAHLFVSRKSSIPSWQRIIQWAELYYRKSFLAPGAATPKEYKSAVSLLNILHGWYHTIFLQTIGDSDPIINVPVYIELGHNVLFKDTIPIVNIGTKISLVDFRQMDKSRNVGIIDLYNDLAIHIRTWGFQQVACQIPSHYTRLYIMPESIQTVDLKITKELLENASKICKHILSGIKDRVFYPSFSEQCLKCPFKNGCSI